MFVIFYPLSDKFELTNTSKLLEQLVIGIESIHWSKVEGFTVADAILVVGQTL